MTIRPRDLALVGTMATLLGGLVVMLLWSDASPVLATEREVPAAPAAAEAPTAQMSAPAPAMPAPEALPAVSREEQAAMTSGIIRGHVSLSAAVVGQLRSVNITIEEALDGPGDPRRTPFVRTQVEPIGRSTPRFVYEDIPFSEYGYWVRVWAEGVNGSRRFVQVNQGHPVADVQLAITEGVPFTVLVRDQQKYPVPDRKVFMVPVGDPPGRRVLQQPSDAFGAAIFEGVLSGKYDLRVGAVQAAMNEPQQVYVQMHSGSRSATVEVATGRSLSVSITQRGGYGIEGAAIKLLAVDSVQLREYEATTDWGGNCDVANILPGTYQLDVRADRFSPATRRVRVPAEGEVSPVEVKMSLRR